MVVVPILSLWYFLSGNFGCRGRVVLIVNVASKWAATQKNYTQLQQLYGKYEADGLAIAAFPCNQFSNQVRRFCVLET